MGGGWGRGTGEGATTPDQRGNDSVVLHTRAIVLTAQAVAAFGSSSSSSCFTDGDAERNGCFAPVGSGLEGLRRFCGGGDFHPSSGTDKAGGVEVLLGAENPEPLTLATIMLLAAFSGPMVARKVASLKWGRVWRTVNLLQTNGRPVPQKAT